MSVLDRSSLEASPLADLHAIASELAIDGYRRLRRPELIAAILDKQGGRDPDEPAAAAPTAEPEPEADRAMPVDADDGDDEDRGLTRRRRGRRGGRGRAATREEDGGEATAAPAADAAPLPAPKASDGSAAARQPTSKDEEPEAPEVAEVAEDDEQLVEGVVELLANGSGFVRVDPPDPADEDVYISSAQVKRCELVSGDQIAGPKRAPRRSERFASLIRIESINGRPASELADGVRFDDLPAAFPDQRLKIGSEDPTLKAIEWLTPFGKGSRVTIVGPPRAGKTEALRKLAEVLTAHDDTVLTVVLAGVRPEEIFEWSRGPAAPVAAASFAASEEARGSAIESVIDQARRLTARGADTIVLIDTLDGSDSQIARKALASARNVVDGGSLTVIATASEPIGGETTVIALDVALTSASRFPALDMAASGTMRPELLVGQAGAEAIARTRLEASGRRDAEG